MIYGPNTAYAVHDNVKANFLAASFLVKFPATHL